MYTPVLPVWASKSIPKSFENNAISRDGRRLSNSRVAWMISLSVCNAENTVVLYFYASSDRHSSFGNIDIFASVFFRPLIYPCFVKSRVFQVKHIQVRTKLDAEVAVTPIIFYRGKPIYE